MVTIVVPEIDDAITHYTQDWGFALIENTRHASGHRWVELGAAGGARLRLAEAKSDEQRSAIGRQAGESVAFFLSIADFDEAIIQWSTTAIDVLEAPRSESYGRVAVLKDKYGNRWDVFDKDYAAAA
ncbi:VOC family protein [Erythrobacter ani]|uniref:VOC family protein n=1 Tax=Erythrobacter ani TaxID=2827235 RepID=A0ABS6SMP1_9SPHN|nr:VOC family protein [Erythrobacter ani]MBV7266106.1 VOC family protein [Erythrobacter ani]